MRIAAAFLLCCCAALGWAEDEDGSTVGGRKLAWQTGKVTVGASLATIDLPSGYRYLQQSDARFVVEDVMHNPPDPTVLGLIHKDSGDEDTAEYFAIVSYEDDKGHIKDDDAKTLNYGDLLKQMQEEARAAAPERRKQGYSGYTLIGWAEQPHYDGATHKLYWAQNAKFDDAKENTLNYNVRLLGARGVLVINAVGSAKQLAGIAEASKAVLAKTELSSGNRYQDFKPGVDKVAAYGIGGLIAGGILAKTGFFAAIGKLLLALIKPLIVGVLVVGGAIAKIFTGRSGEKKA